MVGMNGMIARILRWTGQGAWVPFFRVLANQGRPSPVFFPPELLEQGLGFALTGLTNTFGFQGHAGWVLPWWAEQQTSPDSEAFIPTGVNVLTVNLTHRNWTTLALRGASWKALVDPCGMLTPRAFGPSWIPCLSGLGSTWIPPRLPPSRLEQFLEDGWRDAVVTRYRLRPDLVWSSTASPRRVAGRDWVAWHHHLAWTGPEAVDLGFLLGLRPYNPLTLGPVFRSRVKGTFWSVNRQAGLLLGEAPEAVWFAKGREDPLEESGAGGEDRGRARSGWLGGAARWKVHLEPGQTWELATWALVVAPEDRVRWRSVDAAAVSTAVREPEPPVPLAFRCADGDLARRVRALAGRLSAFDNGSHFTPGAFFYNHAWIRDSTFLALAHDLWGLDGAVDAKEDAWMRTQRWAGHFSTHSGEWDGAGQTLWMWANHALLTGDPGCLARNGRRFARCIRWIARTRRRTKDPAAAHAGLLPAGLSAEHFGPNDHYFWDNFWSLAGMARLGTALGAWRDAPPGLVRFRPWLDRETAAYRALVEARTAFHAGRHGGILPASPYRHPDAACIGTLVALSPLDLKLAGPWSRATAAFLDQNWVRREGFYQPIIHTGCNAYLTAQLARAFQALGDPRWLELFQGILAAASPTLAWPEAIHPRTGGGCMGDGDHGWAVAEVLALIRLALVREQDGRLLLLPNVPAAWWHGGVLALEAAPTSAGRLTFALETESGRPVLTWDLDRSGLREPLPLHLVLPEGWTAQSASAPAPWGAPGIVLADAGRLELSEVPGS